MRYLIAVYLVFAFSSAFAANNYCKDIDGKHHDIGETLFSTSAATGEKFEFTCVDGGTLLGTGWQDPSGVIWFDRANHLMGYYDAKFHCEEIGGRLPTLEELEQLGVYLGSTLDKNGNYDSNLYKPQILSGLNKNNWCWSSTLVEDNPGLAYAMIGNDDGHMVIEVCENLAAVRCVK